MRNFRIRHQRCRPYMCGDDPEKLPVEESAAVPPYMSGDDQINHTNLIKPPVHVRGRVSFPLPTRCCRPYMCGDDAFQRLHLMSLVPPA